MEKWREKAIKILTKHDCHAAAMVLRDGKGYLIAKCPTRVVFYEDIKNDDNASK
jgi:hypothetical protein